MSRKNSCEGVVPPLAVAAVMRQFPWGTFLGEMNWRMGLLEPETGDVTVPNWGTEWWQRVGAGRERSRVDGLGATEILPSPFSSFRDEGMWMPGGEHPLPLCSWDSFHINSISYKGSNPYPIFFVCQDCSCINQDSLWETLAGGHPKQTNKQTKNAKISSAHRGSLLTLRWTPLLYTGNELKFPLWA